MYQNYKTDDGIELVINQETGETFATLAGYSRMSGVNYATVRNRYQRLGNILKVKLSTKYGNQTVSLINEDLIADWLCKDNPKLAKKYYRKKLEIQLNQPFENGIRIKQLEKENKDLMEIIKKLTEINNTLIKNITDKKSDNITYDNEYTQHSEEIWQISGIYSYRYFKYVCVEELELNKDYKWLGDNHMILTRHAAVKMLIILRSESGIILDRFPDAKVTVHDLVKKSERKINRRSPQAK